MPLMQPTRNPSFPLVCFFSFLHLFAPKLRPQWRAAPLEAINYYSAFEENAPSQAQLRLLAIGVRSHSSACSLGAARSRFQFRENMSETYFFRFSKPPSHNHNASGASRLEAWPSRADHS